MIPFRGMKPGIHPFDFEIGDSFFEGYPESQVRKGLVSVHLDFEREERMLILNFTLKGSAEVPCDRCNDPVTVLVNGKERLIMKFGEAYQEQSDEVVIIPETIAQVDVASYLYEYIHLLLPLRRVHGEPGTKGGQCNPAVLQKLNELNEKSAMDPRWDALSKLKENNKL